MKPPERIQKPPKVNIEDLREFLGRLSEFSSETMGEKLWGARVLLNNEKNPSAKNEICDIIARIEERYVPLREQELPNECYEEF